MKTMLSMALATVALLGLISPQTPVATTTAPIASCPWSGSCPDCSGCPYLGSTVAPQAGPAFCPYPTLHAARIRCPYLRMLLHNTQSTHPVYPLKKKPGLNVHRASPNRHAVRNWKIA